MLLLISPLSVASVMFLCDVMITPHTNREIRNKLGNQSLLEIYFPSFSRTENIYIFYFLSQKMGGEN